MTSGNGRHTGGLGSEPFVHEALFYRDPQDYLAGTVPFIRDGLAAGEPVLVAVPDANVDLLSAELGAAAERVRFMDMTEAGRNPGRIIPTVLLAFVAEHTEPAADPGRRVRIIGEPIWPGRSATEYPPCVQHEALINVAVAGKPATMLCLYDASRLDPIVLTDAESTHPILVYGGQRSLSARYTDPRVMVAAFNQPLLEPTSPAVTVTFHADGLQRVRDVVAERAAAAGLSADRMLAVQLAANEVAANTVAHTDGPGTLRVWQDREGLVCEIKDSGSLTDTLAGRRGPVSIRDDDDSRGLLLVHCLCDLVEVHTEDGATTIRLRMTA